MDLKRYDGKCVRITDTRGCEYEGFCDYNSAEYCEHEFGSAEDCLQLVCVLFFERDISRIEILKEEGHYGGFSGPYGRLETEGAEDGPVIIDEFFSCEDPVHIVRMLRCISAMMSGQEKKPESLEGPDFSVWLDKALRELIKYDRDELVHKEALDLLGMITGRKDPEKVAGICGLFCETCPSFADAACDGCLSDHVAQFCAVCRHGFRTCAKEHGITWCSQCPDFPCERQRTFKDAHVENGISHHEHVMEQIIKQRETGISAWVKEQEALNACPVCGEMTVWRDRTCRHCGAVLPR